MKALRRWLFFPSIGYPFQILLYIIYPFVHLYWRLFVYEKVKEQKIPQHETCPDFIAKTRFHGMFIDNEDDHGAFTMYGFAGFNSLVCLLDSEGNFVRRTEAWNSDEGEFEFNRKMVSGDVVVAWCFAMSHDMHPAIKGTVTKAAWNYLKNLGTRSYCDGRNNGDVSNRCNNFGINYCPDSDLLRIGQPMAGPQFYTNSCLFALASCYSWKWKFVFWAHWIFLGGWYWAFSPVIYTKSKPVHYAKDIVMKSLWVHKVIFGNRWWIRIPMRTITLKLSEYKNDLFYAMCGIQNFRPMPAVMNAFFSQKADATSRCNPNDMNPYLSFAIDEMYELSNKINKGVSSKL